MKEELENQLKELKDQSDVIEKKLREIYLAEEAQVKIKLRDCLQNMGNFELSDLIFAAYSRCNCGAGFAHPKNIGIHGSWYCSDILLGRALPSNQLESKSHSKSMPFSFYEIKSENQPSACGATTRPKED